MNLLTAFALAWASLAFSQMPQSTPKPSGRQPLYYITSIAPDGTSQRAAPPYVFPPRSTVYLNVLPTEDGHLVVFVGETNKLQNQSLYFPQKKKEGDRDKDLVKRGENVPVRVQFDDKPSETYFTVALIAQDAATENIVEAIHANRPDARTLLDRYLHGGKGVVDPSTIGDDTKGKHPLIYSEFSLRNR